jgi:hypothetical protein
LAGHDDRRREQAGLVQSLLGHQLQRVAAPVQDDPGPRGQGRHRGLEHDVQQPVEVVRAAQGVADALEAVPQVRAAALELAQAPAQLVGHQVERAAEPAGLALVTGGDRRLEIALGEPLGRLGQLGERLAQPARDDAHQDTRGERAGEQDRADQPGSGVASAVLRRDDDRPRHTADRWLHLQGPAAGVDSAAPTGGGIGHLPRRSAVQ